jgi:tRNA(Arg) A34 adenosine deaminase TadA
MNKSKVPKELVLDILKRAGTNVQVGAVITDKHGIFSWGWNHTENWTAPAGGGTGVHAEVHAISRANPKRLKGATIYIAGIRTRNNKVVESKPCPACMHWIRFVGISRVIYLDKDSWKEFPVGKEKHAKKNV